MNFRKKKHQMKKLLKNKLGKKNINFRKQNTNFRKNKTSNEKIRKNTKLGNKNMI